MVGQILQLFGKYYVPQLDAPPAADLLPNLPTRLQTPRALPPESAAPAAEGHAELAGGNAN